MVFRLDQLISGPQNHIVLSFQDKRCLFNKNRMGKREYDSYEQKSEMSILSLVKMINRKIRIRSFKFKLLRRLPSTKEIHRMSH